MKKITTRDLQPALDCQICGGCQRCRHYHKMRHEITRLRHLIRRVSKTHLAYGMIDDRSGLGRAFEKACVALEGEQ